MEKRAKIRIAALGLGAALVAGVAGPAAYAAADRHTVAVPAALTASNGSSSSGNPAATHGHGHRHRLGGKFAQDLAAQLGVPTDKVTTALKQIRAQDAANRKAAGKGGSKMGDPAQRQQRLDEFAGQLADKLGLDAAKVKDAVNAVLAKEKADRQAALKARLDSAVKSGKISQSDADAYLRVLNSGVLAPK